MHEWAFGPGKSLSYVHVRLTVYYLSVVFSSVSITCLFLSAVSSPYLLFSLLYSLTVCCFCCFLPSVHYRSVVFSAVSMTCLSLPLLCTLIICCFLVNIIHQMVTLNLSCLSKREGQLSKLADEKWRLIDFVIITVSFHILRLSVR